MAKWIDIGAPTDFPVGQRKHLTLDDKTPVCVFNIAGRLYAICNVCPHAGLPLAEGELTGKVITCPFHGYSYDVESGKNVDYADDIPVGTYPIRVEADKVQLDLERGR